MAYPYTFVNGTLANADEVNANFNYAISYARQKDAELAINILINSAAIASTLNPYDDMYLDIFNVAAGNDGTVNTGNTTATYDSGAEVYKNLAESGSPANDATGFTNDSGSTETPKSGMRVVAQTDCVLKTVTKLSTCTATQCYLHNSDGTSVGSLIEQVAFSGDVATFSSVAVMGSGSTYAILCDNNGSNFTRNVEFTPGYPISGTNVDITAGFNLGSIDSSNGFNFANINSDALVPADKLVETNAQSITANPIAHQLYCHNTTTSTGNVTYDVSFDGGTTWVTGQALNTYNTSVHTGSSMLVRINLNEGASSGEVELSDYAIMLFY